MAYFELKTRSHGVLFFHVRDEGGYITVHGYEWQGRQPCVGGWFRGSTLRADSATLEQTARAWWRAYLRNNRGGVK